MRSIRSNSSGQILPNRTTQHKIYSGPSVFENDTNHKHLLLVSLEEIAKY